MPNGETRTMSEDRERSIDLESVVPNVGIVPLFCNTTLNQLQRLLHRISCCWPIKNYIF